MGNQNTRNQDTINWNNIQTENMSSTVPNLKSLSNDANNLIKKLNLPELDTITEADLNSPVNNKYSLERSDSETSPFISSEMYKYFVQNKESLEGGGAHETSKTSSCSCDHKHEKPEDKPEDDDEDDSEENKKSEELPQVSSDTENHNNTTDDDNTDDNSEAKKETSEDQSGGEFSYLSSSAHTEGEMSEIISSAQASSQRSTVQSNKNTTVEMSDSINTSDINMISVESA